MFKEDWIRLIDMFSRISKETYWFRAQYRFADHLISTMKNLIEYDDVGHYGISLDAILLGIKSETQIPILHRRIVGSIVDQVFKKIKKNEAGRYCDISPYTYMEYKQTGNWPKLLIENDIYADLQRTLLSLDIKVYIDILLRDFKYSIILRDGFVHLITKEENIPKIMEIISSELQHCEELRPMDVIKVESSCPRFKINPFLSEKEPGTGIREKIRLLEKGKSKCSHYGCEEMAKVIIIMRDIHMSYCWSHLLVFAREECNFEEGNIDIIDSNGNDLVLRHLDEQALSYSATSELINDQTPCKNCGKSAEMFILFDGECVFYCHECVKYYWSFGHIPIGISGPMYP